MSPIFIIAWVLSVAFSVLISVGILTYIRRTWQQIRLDSDESRDDQLLDGIDRIQTQLYMVTERLADIERQLAPGDDQALLQGGAPATQPDDNDGTKASDTRGVR